MRCTPAKTTLPPKCQLNRNKGNHLQQQQQTFKVWQPPRAARSNRPNTPSDGSKTQWVPYHQANGFQPGIHSSRGLQPVHPQDYHQKYQTPNQTYLNTDLPEARCLASPPHQYHQTGGIVDRHERTQMATYLTNTGRGTLPVEYSAQKSAYLSDDSADTGGTTADKKTSRASTIVGCSHKKRQCASSSTAVELQRKQVR